MDSKKINRYLTKCPRNDILSNAKSRYGGIGRRIGLKIRWEQSRTGSTPVIGTNKEHSPLGAVLFIYTKQKGGEPSMPCGAWHGRNLAPPYKPPAFPQSRRTEVRRGAKSQPKNTHKN